MLPNTIDDVEGTKEVAVEADLEGNDFFVTCSLEVADLVVSMIGLETIEEDDAVFVPTLLDVCEPPKEAPRTMDEASECVERTCDGGREMMLPVRDEFAGSAEIELFVPTLEDAVLGLIVGARALEAIVGAL